MKIAIFRSDYAPLNLEQYNCQEIGLAKSLINAGHEVLLILLKNEKSGGQYPDRVLHKDKYIEIKQLDFIIIPLVNYSLLKGLDKIFEEYKPDICHINEEAQPATIQIARCAERYKTPIVAYHGMYLTPSGLARGAYEKIHNCFFRKKLIKQFHHVFVKTTYAKNYLQERGYQNITVLPVGLDISRLVSTDNVAEKFILVPSECRLVLYVGVFEKRRNIAHLLEIAKLAIDSNLHFILIGTGPEEAYAQQYVIEHNLKNVTLPGSLLQSELAVYYKRASVFILASNYEIFGMVLLEAMFFGLPIVSNYNAGAVDLIDESNGSLVDNLEPALWLQSIQQWADCADQKNKQLIRKKFENNFTWDQISNSYLQSLKDIRTSNSNSNNNT